MPLFAIPITFIVPLDSIRVSDSVLIWRCAAKAGLWHDRLRVVTFSRELEGNKQRWSRFWEDFVMELGWFVKRARMGDNKQKIKRNFMTEK